MLAAKRIHRAPQYRTVGAVYTYSQDVENHAKNQIIGIDESIPREGLTKPEMQKIGAVFCAAGYEVEAYRLHSKKMCGFDMRQENGERLKSYFMLVREGLRMFGIEDDELKTELECVTPDKHALMFNRVVNKKARWNFCVATDEYEQAPDYASGKGTIVPFSKLPAANKVRNGFTKLGRETEINKIEDLFAEANIYYSDDTGIGYHGDSERPLVIGANMGEKRVIEFQAFDQARPIGKCMRFELRNNDIYFMCENACGHNWAEKNHKALHLRHRAGYPKWLQRNETQLKRKLAKKDQRAKKRRK